MTRANSSQQEVQSSIGSVTKPQLPLSFIKKKQQTKHLDVYLQLYVANKIPTQIVFMAIYSDVFDWLIV